MSSVQFVEREDAVVLALVAYERAVTPLDQFLTSTLDEVQMWRQALATRLELERPPKKRKRRA